MKDCIGTVFPFLEGTRLYEHGLNEIIYAFVFGSIRCIGATLNCVKSSQCCICAITQLKPSKPVSFVGLTIGLSFGAEHLDVHRRVNPIKNLSPHLPGLLVTGVDGTRLPIGPIQRLVVKREGERVGEGPCHNDLPVDVHMTNSFKSQLQCFVRDFIEGIRIFSQRNTACKFKTKT